MSGQTVVVVLVLAALLIAAAFWVMKHRAVPAVATEKPSLSPLQEDARRYLNRWVAIAAAWAVPTALLLVWSAAGNSGDGSTSIARESSRSTITSAAPTPHTVTVLPAPGELPMNTDPEPTRWPPPSTSATTSLPAAPENETPQFVSVERLQQGVLTVGGTADELYACGTQDTAYPRIIQRIGESAPLVWRSYCFASNGAVLVDAACAQARQLWGAGECVLYRRGGWQNDSYSVAVLLDNCSSARLSVGATVSENCVGRPR